MNFYVEYRHANGSGFVVYREDLTDFLALCQFPELDLYSPHFLSTEKSYRRILTTPPQTFSIESKASPINHNTVSIQYLSSSKR